MDSFVQFITVLLIFVLVLAVTYFVTRWIGNLGRQQGSSGNIEVIESARVSPGVYVEIVRIGQRYVALSVSKDTSAFICDVPEEDIVFNKNGGAVGFDFGSILDKVRTKKGTDGSDDLGDHRDDQIES